MFADADEEETLVDASGVARRPAQPINISRPSIHGPTVDLAHSRVLADLFALVRARVTFVASYCGAIAAADLF